MNKKGQETNNNSQRMSSGGVRRGSAWVMRWGGRSPNPGMEPPGGRGCSLPCTTWGRKGRNGHQFAMLIKGSLEYSECCQIKANFDCNYIFLIDLAPERISFRVKSMVKVKLQSKFGLIQQDSEPISLCKIYLNLFIMNDMLQMVDLFFVQFIQVQPVFVQSISSNPNLN